MLDERIKLKNVWLAGLLAWLLPGAGHLYQERYFKGAIYFVCILGLFFFGLVLSNWQAIQPPSKEAVKGGQIAAILKYGTQAAVGIPAFYGLVQRERIESPKNVPETSISGKVSYPVHGLLTFRDGSRSGQIEGTLDLEPSQGQFGKSGISGTFTGKLNGENVKFPLGTDVQLAPPVGGSRDRAVAGTILLEQNGRTEQYGTLRGSVPRTFWNWFQAPVDKEQEEDLHRRLGKFHELAMVFTWIAGLLNILAIWDAIDGPAYGYSGNHGKKPQPAPEA
ncbi:DUF6677 family protein [Planctomicrobium sp. SH668]|uniref:DUF6677 family protein n=1 Tax=Planctomicrobium sp. SH668 TaxID=3448126 RepID=UPI003F5B818A